MIPLVLRYLPHLLAGLIVTLALWQAYGWAHGIGYADAERKYLAREVEGYSNLSRLIADERQARIEAEKRIAALRQPAREVQDAIRSNPSNCPVPGPVADGLREQIDATRKATGAG